MSFVEWILLERGLAWNSLSRGVGVGPEEQLEKVNLVENLLALHHLMKEWKGFQSQLGHPHMAVDLVYLIRST